MEQKKLPLLKGFLWKILAGFYYLFCACWLFGPALFISTFMSIDLKTQKLSGIEFNVTPYYALIAAGFLCAVINAGFLIWHFLIKRRRDNIFENRIFFTWASLANFAIFSSLIALAMHSIPFCTLHHEGR